MNSHVLITCAKTGTGDTPTRSPHVPIKPEQIAAAAIEAAQAATTIAQVHVRHPEMGRVAHDVVPHREAVEPIRDPSVDVVTPVGLEDRPLLHRGVLATNRQLVERTVTVLTGMGGRVLTPAEIQTKLGLGQSARTAAA